MKWRFLLTLVVLLFLGACMNKPMTMEYSGLPIDVYSKDNEDVDIDTVIQNSKVILEDYLPNSEFAGLTIFEECDQLPAPSGRYVLLFFQTERNPWRSNPIVFYGSASVRISDEKVDIRIWDASDDYPAKLVYPIPSRHEIEKVLTVTKDYLNEINISICKVEITQLSNDWNVYCDPLNGGESMCEFSIDSTSFRVIEND